MDSSQTSPDPLNEQLNPVMFEINIIFLETHNCNNNARSYGNNNISNEKRMFIQNFRLFICTHNFLNTVLELRYSIANNLNQEMRCICNPNSECIATAEF